jgi:pheromone shutdown protein TraB
MKRIIILKTDWHYRMIAHWFSAGEGRMKEYTADFCVYVKTFLKMIISILGLVLMFGWFWFVLSLTSYHEFLSHGISSVVAIILGFFCPPLGVVGIFGIAAGLVKLFELRDKRKSAKRRRDYAIAAGEMPVPEPTFFSNLKDSIKNKVCYRIEVIDTNEFTGPIHHEPD